MQTIEEHLHAPIGSRFDLITGTSIGGIVALAAAFEVPMHRVVQVFEEHGERIFPGHLPTGEWSKGYDLYKHARRARYSAAVLREAISKLIPRMPRSATRHPIAIPAVNVTLGRPQVFKSRHRADWTRDARYQALEVALATAAPPTYFELAQVDGSLYVDGGLFANAPDLIAIHEAETFFDVRSPPCLLRIGTTTQSYSLSFAAGRNYGVADWMQDARLFAITISSQRQFVDQIVRHRLKERYLRIDYEPSAEQSGDLGLDVATPAARQTLIALGSKAASDVLGTTLALFLVHVPQLKVLRGE